MQNSCLVLKQYVLSCTTHLPILCDLFTRASDVHSYNTISSDVGNLYVNKSRLSIRLNSFSVFGAKLWNCLKPDLRKLRNKPFKNKIHQFLLPVLGDEDDYVVVSKLLVIINHTLAFIINYVLMFHVFL